MRNSTAKPRRRHPQSPKQKAAKPWPDFPLTLHPSGRWCKKVRGKIWYFGKVGDRQAAVDAEAKWNAEKEDLYAGRVPRDRLPEGVTLRDLANLFLTYQKSRVESVPRQLSPTTFACHHRTCGNILAHFGAHRRVDDIRPLDFQEYGNKLRGRMGLIALSNEIQRTRSLFLYAFESDLVSKPVKFGPGFKKPGKQALETHRNEKKARYGPKLFTPHEIRKLMTVASVQLKAMILLGVNGGLGNSDLANLPIRAVDLETGWVDYPRPKTATPRRFPLWPETVKALRAVLAERITPKNEDDAHLLFVTRCGGRWAKAVFEPNAKGKDGVAAKHKMYNDDSVGKEFVKLFTKAKVERKAGCSFYTLRHVFETVAGDSRDQVAVDSIMGHSDPSMGDRYREAIFEPRLTAVVEHVRKWMFGK